MNQTKQGELKQSQNLLSLVTAGHEISGRVVPTGHFPLWLMNSLLCTNYSKYVRLSASNT